MIWRIPGISLNLHYPKEDDGELYTACPIIKGSRGIEPLNPLPQRRIRLTLPAYLCLKTALRRSEIREYYRISPEIKKELLRIPGMDVKMGIYKRPLMNAAAITCASLAKCYSGDLRKISYPVIE